MAGRSVIQLKDRSLFGKKVRALRSEGWVPANLVIPGEDSRAFQADERELVAVMKQTARSGLIDLELPDGPEAALIGDLDVHPVTLRLRHITFRKIDLTKPIDVTVPMEFFGDSPASQAGDRFVVHEIMELAVRCLPDAIPQSVSIDESALDQIGDVLRVSSVIAPDGIELLNDPEQVICRVEQERAEEEVEGVELVVAGEPVEEGDGGPDSQPEEAG